MWPLCRCCCVCFEESKISGQTVFFFFSISLLSFCLILCWYVLGSAISSSSSGQRKQMRVSQPWKKKKSWTTSAGPCLHRTFVVWRRHTAAAEHFKLTLAFNNFDSNCMTLPANSWPFIPEKLGGNNWHFLVQWLLLSLATNYESNVKFNRKR